MEGVEEPGPHVRGATCSPYITLPDPQRQNPEGQVPSWGTTCAPAILAESTRTAEVKVRGHPLFGGPPALPQTSTRAGKRRPGSHPSDGPNGPPRIQAHGRRVAHPSTNIHQGANTGREALSRIPTKHRAHWPFANPHRDVQNHQGSKSQLPSRRGAGCLPHTPILRPTFTAGREGDGPPQLGPPRSPHRPPHKSSRRPRSGEPGSQQGSQRPQKPPHGRVTCTLFH